ncbi:hypothetical protein BC832DRAFT_139025 [Gaertneriomyces semiglobifer]|nr:hypothetical protein BC832DRAFT_139025 [Gaertneriomyces semiglobifer]
MASLPLPPSDADEQRIIDTIAASIIRNGPAFYDDLKVKLSSAPKYQFLLPGNRHHEYFLWKLGQSAPQSPSPPSHPAPSESAPLMNLVAPIVQLLSGGPLPGTTTSGLSDTASPPAIFVARDALALSLGGDAASVLQFLGLLEALMKECSQSNIRAGRMWIFDHCKEHPQFACLLRLLSAVAHSYTDFASRLHIVYLLNDILYSGREKNLQREIIQGHLTELIDIVRAAYTAAKEDESKEQKMIKVLRIWREKHFLDEESVEQLYTSVIGPAKQATGHPHSTIKRHSPSGSRNNDIPMVNEHAETIASTDRLLPPQPSSGLVRARESINPPPPAAVKVPERSRRPFEPYYASPAGLMVDAVAVSVERQNQVNRLLRL